jgi:hypothetical protein
MNNDQQLDLLIKNMAQQHQANLPSPGLIWWRAQIQKKFSEKERIERPMVIVPIIVWMGVLAVIAAIAAWNWREIQPVVSGGGATLALASAGAAIVIMAGWLLREVVRKS